MMLPALVPKVTPLALLKPAVWNANEPLLAESAWFDWLVRALCEAVITPALSPKLTPFELLNVTDARLALVLLAEKLMLPDGAFAPEIVMALPFWLRVILLPPANNRVPVDIRE